MSRSVLLKPRDADSGPFVAQVARQVRMAKHEIEPDDEDGG